MTLNVGYGGRPYSAQRSATNQLIVESARAETYASVHDDAEASTAEQRAHCGSGKL